MTTHIIKLTFLFVCLAATLALQSARTFAAGTRDPFLQPFSSNSPWNMPVGSGAEYEAIPHIETVRGGINATWLWTTGIYKATAGDRIARLYIYKGDLGSVLRDGSIKTAGNDAATENKLRSQSGKSNHDSFNDYSTTRESPPNPRTAPMAMRKIDTAWTNTIYVPENAASSPDQDAHLAIMQPNGLVLECYNAVVCANGDIITAIASFSDPRLDGTGYQNGRMTSLLPNYAGKIRKSEIFNGVIPHALCCTVPATMLTTQCVWPASAFDRNDGYTGTVPMGALLAIPASVDIRHLGLSVTGMIVARAAQNYGIYVAGRGGAGLGVQAELGCGDALFSESDHDLTAIVHALQRVVNNSPRSIGGGGKPRMALAPELMSPTTLGAPLNLAPIAGDSKVFLNWTPGNAATSYTITRGVVGAGQPGVVVASGVTKNHYSDTGLSDGTQYSYVIRSVNATGTSGASNEVLVTPSASFRINVAGGGVGSFAADANFSGGGTAMNWTGAVDTSAVIDPAPQAVYQTERYGNFTYTIPNLTAHGAYRVRLHFTEDYRKAVGERVFNVTINGKQVLTNFDIFEAAGARHKANIQEFETAANANGEVRIEFITVVDSGKVDGIEILAATAAPN